VAVIVVEKVFLISYSYKICSKTVVILSFVNDRELNVFGVAQDMLSDHKFKRNYMTFYLNGTVTTSDKVEWQKHLEEFQMYCLFSRNKRLGIIIYLMYFP
jgi:hypothetical protein